MQPGLIGTRLREQRKAMGLSQVALAQQVGISPSYLNLIEGNRRNVAGALLMRMADALHLPLEAVDGAAERRLVDALRDLRATPLLAALALDGGAIPDLVARHPHWARALLSLHRSCVDAQAAATALADRLNQDPALAEAMHSLVTHVSSIRSAAEILADETALGAVQRRRFVANLNDDSRRLSDVAESLAGYFSGSRTGTRSITPAEEVDDLFIDNDNHFPRLEAEAETLRAAAGLAEAAAHGAVEAALARHLQHAHGVAVESLTGPLVAGSGALRQLVHFDAQRRVLSLSPAAWPATRRFELARLLAELGASAALDATLAGAPSLAHSLAPSPARAASAARARRALAGYVAAAMLMPYAEFHAAAAALRHDIDQVASRFGCSLEQVCHRLTTLRRPGAEGLRLGFLRANVAGQLSKRLPLPRLPLPRAGAVCPLWPVYEAFQVPGSLVRQLAVLPGGDRFLLLARTIEKERQAFGMPRQLTAVLLMCEPLDADRLVYADGLDLSPSAPATPVGQSCRTCVRGDCAYRQEDRIVDSAMPSPRHDTSGKALRQAAAGGG